MVPIKTDKAHAALRARNPDLSVLQRQILILCNGKRSADELAGMLGEQTRPMLQDLALQGWLAWPEQTTPAERAGQDSRTIAAAAGARKRSLVMARMYAFDMLERALGAQSQVARQHLRAAASPQALADALCDCVALLVELADPGVALRISDQLLDMLPEDQPGLAARMRLATSALRGAA